MQYTNEVLHYFSEPKTVGTLDQALPSVVVGKAGSLSAGEVAHLYFDVEHAQIKHATFKAYGNVFVIAACAYVTETLKGQSIAHAKAFNSAQLIDRFEVPAIKKHSILLVEDALRAALHQVESQPVEGACHV
jgi:nitrogen fixation protein NifU and related proteins